MHPENTPSENAAGDHPVAAGAGRAYYLSQSCGWGLYAILLYLLGRSSGPQAAILVGVWCGIGLLGTHLLRTYANHRRWRTIPQLVPPFAVAALLIPAVMNGADVAISTLVFHHAPEPRFILLAHYFQATLVVSVWCAVFLSANEARRRRVAEMEALRLALVAQVSQFHALRSQLNPHFLFNSLNNLRELIDEDRDRAKQVVDRLSELLRYTLRAGRVETVSFKEELRAVEDYLSLEKVRFEERLRVRFEIEPSTLDTRLPPMILQTLAENGVKHGISQLPAGGDLSIVARISGGQLRIAVTSSGTLSTVSEKSSSVGLDNARERLRLMYGDTASLTVAALDDCNVRAALAIPLSSNGVGP
jgi:LytS/YehU family sensor histidine kinase